MTVARMTEDDYLRRVLDTARRMGWLVHHCRPARMASGRWATPIQGDAGFVDLVLARHGVVMFRELKTDTGRLSDAQQRWAEHLPDWGVWRPKHWDAVLDELRGAA